MKKKLLQKLSKKNICIASHIFSSGPALDLEDYLKEKIKSLFFVGHPFSFRKDKRSFYRLYKSGELTKEHKAIEWVLPEVLLYLKDAFYTMLWVGTKKEKTDLFIGSDNFTAFLGLLLKKWGKVKDVVLYTIDYLPQRFKNPVLNGLYHYFDKKCLEECKIVWNVSQVMAGARGKVLPNRPKGYTQQIVVPLGLWLKRFRVVPFSQKKRFQLVFMGHLLEKQGIDIVIEAFPRILKHVPQARLVIIGTGEYEQKLIKLVSKLKLQNKVRFTGYIEDHQEVEKILSESILAIAMYKPDAGSFTNWADPAKIKNYLGARLPVVLTNVPPIAQDLLKKQCGIISEYDEYDFATKAINLLKDTKKLQQFSKNAYNYSKQFDWDNVFEKALSESIE